MTQGYIFSWAENAEGRMVHVDVVPRGLKCNCFCSNCHEPLMARHGDVREHHFAHHSEDRGANLNICYMVTLYKLAEQIIKEHKRIHAPSYYGIFKDKDIVFKDVKIDGQYEREDKQPDVIAIAEDGQQYLIEFVFQWKVQHNKDIDYAHLNCIEIDLSNQTFETLKDFLLKGTEDKRWVNCDYYFNLIEPTYAERRKFVNVKSDKDCESCSFLYGSCCAVKYHGYYGDMITIEHGGQQYRLCKTDLFNQQIERKKQDEILFALMKENVERELREERYARTTHLPSHHSPAPEVNSPVSERSCFNCACNLAWDNRDGLASCGIYMSLGIPKRNNPTSGKTCRRWSKK